MERSRVVECCLVASLFLFAAACAPSGRTPAAVAELPPRLVTLENDWLGDLPAMTFRFSFPIQVPSQSAGWQVGLLNANKNPLVFAEPGMWTITHDAGNGRLPLRWWRESATSEVPGTGTWHGVPGDPRALTYGPVPFDATLWASGSPDAEGLAASASGELRTGSFLAGFSTPFRTASGGFRAAELNPIALYGSTFSDVRAAVDGAGNGVVFTRVDASGPSPSLAAAVFDRSAPQPAWTHMTRQANAGRYSEPIRVGGAIHVLVEIIDPFANPPERYIFSSYYDLSKHVDGEGLGIDGADLVALEQEALTTDPLLRADLADRLAAAFFKPSNGSQELHVSRRHDLPVPCGMSICWDTRATGITVPPGATILDTDMVCRSVVGDQIAVAWIEESGGTHEARVAWREDETWLQQSWPIQQMPWPRVRLSWSDPSVATTGELVVHWADDVPHSSGSGPGVRWRVRRAGTWELPAGRADVGRVSAFDVVGSNRLPFLVCAASDEVGSGMDHFVVLDLVWRGEISFGSTGQIAPNGSICPLTFRAEIASNGYLFARWGAVSPSSQAELWAMNPRETDPVPSNDWQQRASKTGATALTLAVDDWSRLMFAWTSAGGSLLVDRWERQ